MESEIVLKYDDIFRMQIKSLIYFLMGNTGCGDMCVSMKEDKQEIMQIEITPRYDAIEWIKEEQQPTGHLQVPFKHSQKVIEYYSAEKEESSFNNPPKIIQWNDEPTPSVSEDQELPVVETKIEENHLIVPIGLIRQRIPDKIKLIVERDLDKQYLADDSKWFLLPSGNYFSGRLRNGAPEGKGLYLLPHKVFCGEVSEGKPEGTGILMSQSLYCKGDFSGGKISGQGIMQLESAKIQGTFKNGGIINGKITTPQYEYQGQFQKGQPSGNGIYYNTATKVSYKGGFLKGKFNGEGILTTQQYIFRGTFQNGLKTGKGQIEYCNRNSRSKSGQWDQDYIVNPIS